MKNIPWDNPIIISAFFSATAILASGFFAFLAPVINGVLERRLKRKLTEEEKKEKSIEDMGSVLLSYVHEKYGEYIDLSDYIDVTTDFMGMGWWKKRRFIKYKDTFFKRIDALAKKKGWEEKKDDFDINKFYQLFMKKQIKQLEDEYKE